MVKKKWRHLKMQTRRARELKVGETYSILGLAPGVTYVLLGVTS